MNTLVQDERVRAGLTYAEYVASWRENLLVSLAELGKDERKRVFYARYNIERHDRVRDSYRPSDELLALGEAVEAPQMWVLLSEDWCGDSAFALPVIAAAADAIDAELRILRRDDHPDIIDAYLTNGTRSIPKLIALSMKGEDLFTWGPRPSALVEAREQWQAEGKSKGEMIAAGVEWYEAGNWTAIEQELIQLIQEAVGVSIS